jgi:hypothetical protein
LSSIQMMNKYCFIKNTWWMALVLSKLIKFIIVFSYWCKRYLCLLSQSHCHPCQYHQEYDSRWQASQSYPHSRLQAKYSLKLSLISLVTNSMVSLWLIILAWFILREDMDKGSEFVSLLFTDCCCIKHIQNPLGLWSTSFHWHTVRASDQALWLMFLSSSLLVPRLCSCRMSVPGCAGLRTFLVPCFPCHWYRPPCLTQPMLQDSKCMTMPHKKACTILPFSTLFLTLIVACLLPEWARFF